MYVLNLIIIAFIYSIIFSTVFHICDENQAISFLKIAKCVPSIQLIDPIVGCGLFVAVGILNIAQQRFRQRQWLVFIIYVCNLGLCCVISYSTSLSYKGIFLIVIAESFLNLQAMPLRIISLLLAFLSYIAFDYDFMSVMVKMIPFPNYIAYYAPQTRMLLYGIKTTLESINLILFILFLYQVIQGKIRENKEFIRVNTELQKTIERLKEMTHEIEEAAKIKERNRLAHDIHDILGHSLTCIATGLEASIALANNESSAPLVGQLGKIKRFADVGLRDIRRSVHALEKDSIKDATLIEALKGLVKDVNDVKVHNVTLDIAGEPPDMEYDERQIVYRIVQESITNSINHGCAKDIAISLRFDNAELELRTKDDGKGCDAVRENFGLSYMRAQAKMLNGRIEFETKPGEGFAICAVLPIRRHPE